MFASSIVLAAAALSGLANAQNLSGAVFDGQNYSVSGPIAIVPSSLPVFNRSQICLAQTNTCGQVCGASIAENNTCIVETLLYNCTCGNGMSPNLTEYQQSLNAMVCEKWIGFCVDAHPNDASGQMACRSQPCGTKLTTDGQNTTTTTSSASMGATGASGNPSSNPASTSATSTTHSSAAGATAMAFVAQYGTPLMAGGMAVAFGLAL